MRAPDFWRSIGCLDPEQDCGLVVLALGKHGARELNYSSDIDLIVLYDPRRRRFRRGREPAAAVRKADQGAGAAPAGAHERRLCAAGRSAPQARSRLDPGRAVDRQRLSPITRRSARTGSAPLSSRRGPRPATCARRALSRRSRALHLAQVFRLCVDRRHPCDEAPDPCRARPRAASSCPAMTSSSGAAASARSSSSSRRSSSSSAAAGRRCAARARSTCSSELPPINWIAAEAVDDLTEAYLFLRAHRTPAADGRRRADAAPAVRARRALTRFARFCGYAAARRFRRGPHLSSDPGREALCATLRTCAEAQRRGRQSRFHRRHRRSRDDRRPCADSAFSVRKPPPRPFRGWHFGRRAAIRSARAREVLTELTPALLEAFAGIGDADAALAAFDVALARMPRRGRAPVDPAVQRRRARIVRRCARRRAAARRCDRDAPACARRRDRSGSRRRFRPGASTKRRCARPGRDVCRASAATSRRRSTARATSPPRRCFSSASTCSSGRLDTDRAGRAYSALAQALIEALLKHVIDGLRG